MPEPLKGEIGQRILKLKLQLPQTVGFLEAGLLRLSWRASRRTVVPTTRAPRPWPDLDAGTNGDAPDPPANEDPVLHGVSTRRSRKRGTARRPATEHAARGSRQAILRIVEGSPGIGLSDLQRCSRLGWGNVQYHLWILERAGLIRRVTVGRSALVYPASGDPSLQHRMAVVSDPLTRRIAEAIVLHPDWNQKRLCQSLGVTRKVFLTHLRRLSQARLVSVQRVGGERRYHSTPELRGLLDGPHIQRIKRESGRHSGD